MAQAIVDPAEIRRFAHHLKQFGEELRDRLAALRGQLVGLGDSWRDQEHESFRQEFEQTAHVLEAFLASAEASYITGQVLAVDGGFDAAGIGLPTLRGQQRNG